MTSTSEIRKVPEPMSPEMIATLERLKLIGAIGKSILNHEAEIRRLNYELSKNRGVDGVIAPDGYRFMIKAPYHEYEVSQWRREVGYGGEMCWHRASKEKFEPSKPLQGPVFIADRISADSASIFAYGVGGDLRCQIDTMDEISLVYESQLPTVTVNTLFFDRWE